MKKHVLTLLTILSCGSAFALPLTNPGAIGCLSDGTFWDGCVNNLCDPCYSFCDNLSFRLGTTHYCGFVNDIEIQYKGETVTVPEDQLLMDSQLLDFSAGTIGFAIGEYVEFNGVIGTAKFSYKGNQNAFLAPDAANDFTNATDVDTTMSVYTKRDFLLGVEFRAAVTQCGVWGIGVTGGGYYTKLPIDHLGHSIELVYTGKDADLSPELTFWAYQAGLVSFCKLDCLSVYGGVKLERVKGTYNGNDDAYAIPTGSGFLSTPGDNGADLPDASLTKFKTNSSNCWSANSGFDYGCGRLVISVEAGFGYKKGMEGNIRTAVRF